MHSEPSTLQQSKEHIRILLPVSPEMRKRSNYSAEAITVSLILKYILYGLYWLLELIHSHVILFTFLFYWVI